MTNSSQMHEVPNGKSTPVFTWSPTPHRKETLNFVDNKFKYKLDEKKKYYPNCDFNVWLRSCEEEITEPIEGITKGFVPSWLRGCLLRNGPGSLKAGDDYFNHLFDSSALLHRFNIDAGRITYQCRFLQSDVYKKNWEAKRIVLTEFGTKAVPDPCKTIFRKFAAIFNPKSEVSDNSMISLYPFGDEIYAFGEIPIIHRVDTESLETQSKVDVSNYVSIVHHTSHPHVMDDGSVYNLALSIYSTGPRHTIVKFPPKLANDNDSKTMFENASLVAGMPARWPLHPPYMHTFGITDRFFVIVEQPLSVSITAMAFAKFKQDPLAGCFRWYQEENTKISLLNRESGNVDYEFYTESFFYLHIINQYEISDYVVLDICAYRDPAMLDCMFIETMKTMQQNPNYAKMFRSKPIRFVLPLKMSRNRENLIHFPGSRGEAFYQNDGKIFVKPEKLCNLGCETPRINYERYLGKMYRYFYAISADVDAVNPGTIIKVDTETKTAKTWCEENCYPSEPIFVPRPGSLFEDDGVVLASMVWGGEDTNHAGLVILDAITFKEIGRAEFQTPGPVPKCLHGWFLPKK